jgi:uncharacterized NAD(P)/FAD-binding protein YdhS
MLPGSGNSVAEIHEVKEECSRCNGEGYLQHREIKEFIKYCREEGLDWQQAMDLHKVWRANGGDIPCTHCEDGIVIKQF